MVITSVGLYAAENGINEAIDDPFDALWWGVATMTTVGYGDVVPVTPEGRFAAMVLMVPGIALFSAVTAVVTSCLLSDNPSPVDELRTLGDLRDRGLVTEEEFERKRQDLAGKLQGTHFLQRSWARSLQAGHRHLGRNTWGIPPPRPRTGGARVDESTLLSGVAVVLSVVTFVVSLRLGQRAEARARKPVLVFVDDPDQGCWVLRNVGNGPALNVLTAQRKHGQWFNPVKVPPLGKDGAFPLRWLGRMNNTGLGVCFADFEGAFYTTTLGEEVVRTHNGCRLPAWPDGDMSRYWDVAQYAASDPPRHPIESDFDA